MTLPHCRSGPAATRSFDDPLAAAIDEVRVEEEVVISVLARGVMVSKGERGKGLVRWELELEPFFFTSDDHFHSMLLSLQPSPAAFAAP